jgi:hypothetical protein
MQTISTVLPLSHHNTDTKLRVMVTWHVGALRKALLSLSECYEGMSSNTTSLTQFLPRDHHDGVEFLRAICTASTVGMLIMHK